ncbi:hypothetical protein ET495_16230 [Xylanimonas allomyrinae]|uniref:Clp R domain-containing protein n=1 Tax=Xylanimonas allomyrinae TaxID=2509459 RepID=A0A4P6EP32_9MICO|nr:Clp protease N-terminal domain-containing protein [Xylanimonas allomyrinae]QAY64504.1 hypothetical protein ET495_16230 [Xylanimonas allomyrinae]
MFERFTKEARVPVIEAQFVARSAHTPTIDARHVLVALAESEIGPAVGALRTVGVDVGELARRLRAELAGIDAAALAAVGVDLDEVRRSTDATFGEGAFDGVGGRRGSDRKHIPFASDAKKALSLALREAIRLGSPSIDSGHLLLGILRGGSPAAKALHAALTRAGSDDDALRAAVERSGTPAT